MKKKGLHIRIVISLLIIAVLISKNYKGKGTFEELVLDKYLDVAVEKKFDTLRIEKRLNTGESIIKRTDDINKINESLSKFNEYKLVEYQGRMPKNEMYDYNISFEGYSLEQIEIMTNGDKYLWVFTRTLVTNEDKKTKTTTVKTKETLKRYEITNTSIDMDYLDDLFNSLSE